MSDLPSKYANADSDDICGHRHLSRQDLTAPGAEHPHPCLVKFEGVVKSSVDDTVFYIMEEGTTEFGNHESFFSVDVSYERELYAWMKTVALQKRSGIKNFHKIHISKWESKSREKILHLAYGLQFMHRRDMVHGDFKNENTVKGKQDGFSKMIDFGMIMQFSEFETVPFTRSTILH